jgi:putative transposase
MGQALRVYSTDTERQQLTTLVRTGQHSARELNRARILLLADRSSGKWKRYGEIAEAVGSDSSTVNDICRKYALGGLEIALKEKTCPGRAPKITGEIEARLVVLACSDPPQGQARWTLKLLAAQLVELKLVDSISKVAVHQRLKKTNLSLGKSKLGVSPNPAPSLSPRWKTS